MTKKIAVILFILLMGSISESKLKGIFRDHFKAPRVILDDKQIYIVDRVLRKIVIYRRDNFQKTVEFGRPGQGPGEFMGISSAALSNDYIYVSSYPKLCIFSKTGKLIKEIKGPVEAGSFTPLKKNFIGISYPGSDPASDKQNILFSLYDGNLKKQKDIFLTKIKAYNRYKGNKKFVSLIRDCVEAYAYKERLYIGTTEKGFYFAVFSLGGNLLYEIQRNEAKHRVPDSKKRKILHGLKKSMGDTGWNAYKARVEIEFSDYYPAYQSFFIADGKIYVFGFLIDEKYDMIILDLKGNPLMRKLIPAKDSLKFDPNFYYIENGTYYRIIENDEEETWQLYGIDLMK